MISAFWNHSLTALASRLLLVYVLICLIVWLLQDFLLYFPLREDFSITQAKANSLGLQMWPDPDNPQDYRALFYDPYAPENQNKYERLGAQLPEESRGTIVLCHGNAASAVQRAHYIAPFASRGFRVLICEYVGYGARDGKVREAKLVADIQETVRLAHSKGLGPIILWGESLGSGVIGSALRENLPVSGAVFFTPFDSLPAVAQSRFWFLPAYWLVTDRYDTVKNIQNFDGPVAVVIAEHDNVIDPSHAERLFKSAPEPKLRYMMPGATHNRWDFDPRSKWWDTVLDFVNPKPTKP